MSDVNLFDIPLTPSQFLAGETERDNSGYRISTVCSNMLFGNCIVMFAEKS